MVASTVLRKAHVATVLTLSAWSPRLNRHSFVASLAKLGHNGADIQMSRALAGQSDSQKPGLRGRNDPNSSGAVHTVLISLLLNQ